MRQRYKTHVVMALLMVGVISVSAKGSAEAKEEREKISNVNLSLISWIAQGTTSEAVEISVEDDAEYWIDSYEVLNVRDEGWTPYDSPRLEIHLTAADGFYFRSESSSYIKVRGEDVLRFVKAERDDDKSWLSVVVDLKPVGGQLGNPASLEWKKGFKAYWEKGYKAERYEVELYRDEERVRTEETTGQSFDFTASMLEAENYYFKVRSVRRMNKNTVLYGDWIQSDIYDYEDKSANGSSQNTTVTAVNGGPGISDGGVWIQNSSGWWYQFHDGTWPVNAWRQINGAWYFFGTEGYMKTGMQLINGAWYYFYDSGAMAVGWVNLNSEWYYFGADGARWYSAVTPDGYSVGADGAWIQ